MPALMHDIQLELLRRKKRARDAYTRFVQKVIDPLARFFTILMIRFNPSPTAFVSRLLIKGKVLCLCFRIVLTNLRTGSNRLFRAVVVYLLKKRSAAQGDW
jgi:hypothetical protein